MQLPKQDFSNLAAFEKNFVSPDLCLTSSRSQRLSSQQPCLITHQHQQQHWCHAANTVSACSHALPPSMLTPCVHSTTNTPM